MTIYSVFSPPWLRVVPALLLSLVLTGCATRSKIDWASRVDNYTFDQAVTELGPPDKSAELSDGSVVAEWLAQRGFPGSYSSFGYGPGYAPWAYYWPAPIIHNYYEPPTPDCFLRLSFGPDGKMKEWKRVRK